MHGKIVKHQGKLFGINLSWYEFDKSKHTDQIAKLLKLNYGVSFHTNTINEDGFKKKRYLVGLANKELSACYCLASIVANKFKSGIFITDKLVVSDQENLTHKLYWVCIFQNKEVISKVEINSKSRDINISGDELLNESQLKQLIELYTLNHKVSIFTDLADAESLNLKNSREYSIDQIISSRLSSKFLIRKLHSNKKIYLALTIGVCLLGLFVFGFHYYDKSQVKQVQHKPKANIKKPKPITEEELVLKDIKANSVSTVLNSLITQFSHIPMVIAGWSIQNIAYTAINPKNIQILYKKSPGMDIVTSKMQVKDFVSKYKLQNVSVSFSNNDTVMQLNIEFQKESLPIINNFTKEEVAKVINMDNAIDAISAIQKNFLNYRLGQIQKGYGKYSKQNITISNINLLMFYDLTELANRHRNFVVNSIIGKFDSNFNISWSFKGDIYE